MKTNQIFQILKHSLKKIKKKVNKLNFNDNDIINYFKQTRMSDELNLSMFKELWYPDKFYQFPTS
jgi:hypothetical protein